MLNTVPPQVRLSGGTALAMAGCAPLRTSQQGTLLVLKAEGQGEPGLGAGYPGRASWDSSVRGRKVRGSEGE